MPSLPPGHSSSCLPFKKTSLATTNSTNVKATPGDLVFIHVVNINAAVRYLKLYDLAAAPTVGTDVPVLTLAIPGSTAGAGFNLNLTDAGLYFANGIGFGLTTGVADNDTGAVAAGEQTVNLGYR